MMKYKILGSVAALALMFSTGANALVIDTFGDAQSLDTTGTASGTVSGGGIIGGEREASISGGPATLGIDSPVSSALSISNDTGALSTSLLRYDGVGVGGLGGGLGVDATESGAQNAFDLFIITDDSPIDIRIDVTSASGSSGLTLTAPGNIFNIPAFPSQSLIFEYADFLVTSGTGADFTALTGIDLSVISIFDATDITIDFLATTTTEETIIVPEPGSLAILGLGLIGLAGCRSRLKKQG